MPLTAREGDPIPCAHPPTDTAPTELSAQKSDIAQNPQIWALRFSAFFWGGGGWGGMIQKISSRAMVS